MDMLVATQAGMLRKAENTLIRSDLARAGQFKEVLARGEVTPELEKLLGESIGIGREPTGPAAEVGTEVMAEQPAGPPEGLAGLLGSFSVGEGGAASRRRDEFVHKVRSALAKHDELFRYGRTRSKDAGEIAKAVSLQDKPVTASESDGMITFQGRNGKLQIGDADTDRPYISSPEANSQGEPDGGGAQLYAAALDWITTTGSGSRTTGTGCPRSIRSAGPRTSLPRHCVGGPQSTWSRMPDKASVNGPETRRRTSPPWRVRKWRTFFRRFPRRRNGLLTSLLLGSSMEMEELSPAKKLQPKSLGENPANRESDFQLFKELSLQDPRYAKDTDDQLRMVWNRNYPKCSLPLSDE